MDRMPDVDPAYHRALFKVTDKLTRAHLDPDNQSAGDLTSLLRELCSALRKSVNGSVDELFRAAAGLTNRPELQPEAAALVKDAGTFAKFIEFEDHALRDCGVSDTVARYISANVANLRDHLAQPKLDPEKTMAALRRFQDDVCTAADQASADLAWREKRHKIKVGATIASGFSLSLANAAAVAKSGGLFVPFATLSIAAGGILVTTAGRFKGPAERKPGQRA